MSVNETYYEYKRPTIRVKETCGHDSSRVATTPHEWPRLLASGHDSSRVRSRNIAEDKETYNRSKRYLL